ncbi:MAG TPA: hypothetical protein VEY51_04185, partial [Chondromyces sp.]|nr:hypothetical protein [Chondromyces sp.]
EEAYAQLEKLFGVGREMGEQNSNVKGDTLKEQAYYVIDRIREIMWYHGNVVRSEKHLTEALDEIRMLEAEMAVLPLFEQPSTRKLAVKVKDFLKLSQILLQAMLERKESRGAHYREDFPHEDAEFNKRLFVSKTEDRMMRYTFLNQ